MYAYKVPPQTVESKLKCTAKAVRGSDAKRFDL